MSVQLVSQVRNKLFPDLEGKPLNDRVKAYLVTIHTAFQKAKQEPNEEWGVITANPGSDNNVNGYTVGIVAKRNGEHYDMLINKFGLATPAWQPQPDNPSIPSRWVVSPATDDIFDGGTVPPAPIDKLDEILGNTKAIMNGQIVSAQALDSIKQTLAVIEQDTADILKKCQEILDKPIPVALPPNYLTTVFGRTITSKPEEEKK